MTVLLIILGVLMLVGLVILHELGHFYAARKSGVEVEEFGIGFPPKAKTLGTKNGTEYTLNWLPLGGFVRLKGENDSDTAKGTFGAARLRDKVMIMLAGVAVNVITAVFILTIVSAIALPQALGDDQFYVASDSKVVTQEAFVRSLVTDSPADAAGVEPGDTFVSVVPKTCVNESECEIPIVSAQDVSDTTPKLAGQEVTVNLVSLDGDQKSVDVQLLSEAEVTESRQAYDACDSDPEKTDDQKEDECGLLIKGYFGVGPGEYIERRATWSAPIVATVFSGQVVQETFKTFGNVIGGLFKGDVEPARDNVTGIVGIGYVLNELSSRGFMAVLFLMGIISLSLAIMNVLPIPALDGGRLFVTLLFRAIKKPLTKDLEEKIHGTGFMALMVLFVLITVLDVQRFILN